MIIAAVEGYPDAEVARKILEHVGLNDPIILQKRGKQHLDSHLPELNRTAQSIRCLVIRDLDRDAKCPAELVAMLLPKPSQHLRFRVAVREIEAWLLADGERFASFLGVPERRIPVDPDSLDDPKHVVASLARRSRSLTIREQIPPRPGSGIPVGPAYPGLLGAFIRESWRPGVAELHSPSLASCIAKLRTW